MAAADGRSGRRRCSSHSSNRLSLVSFVAVQTAAFKFFGRPSGRVWSRSLPLDAGAHLRRIALPLAGAVERPETRAHAPVPGRQQKDPELAHYAAEIKREHVDPSRRLANIIAPVNLPDTTHHKDFAAPSADLIRSYKRVGKDYRQAGNKSYIRLNLVDPSVAAAPGLLAVTGAGAAASNGGSSAGVAVPVPLSEISSATPSISIRVPFTATTTHATSFQDHTAHIPGIHAARAKASGSAARPVRTRISGRGSGMTIWIEVSDEKMG